jgi:ubiquinone/menaquinone biosynthesis C-methylase UbiE
LVDELGIGAGRTVVDLAAGTGKFTRLLVPTGANVIAVEPVAEMRAAIHDIEARDGTAESIPLPDGSVDAVTVAQALHWFRLDTALAEIARVLRPGGGLGFLWNRRDERVPWVKQMSDVLHWHEHEFTNYEIGRDWPGEVAAAGDYSAVQFREFPYEQEVDRERLADRVRSLSYIACLDAADQEDAVGRVLALVEDKPETFVLPYRTLVYWCKKRS